jgi:heavy metal efflux system protein
MLNRLVTFALAQRAFILAAVVILIGYGVYATINLPIEAFPDVQDVQVSIVTQLPGLAPEEVERAVSLPIEREMNGVPRMTQVRSVSMTGLSIVTLTFADNTDDYFARQQVTEKLQNVTLPAGIQPQLAPLTTAVGEIFRYIVEAPAGMPLYEVRTLQDWVIRPALRRVGGVADVVSFGGALKEVQVRVDPARLRKFSVSIDQVSQALTNNNANAGGGVLRRGDEALVIRSVGLLSRVEDVERVAVAVRDGRPIQVSDVATVEIGARTRSGVVSFDARDDVVEGIVQMVKGQNATTIVANVRAEIATLQAKLPAGVRVVPIYDRTDLVKHTVHTVTENLLLGAFLVVAILVIFLRSWFAATIVALIIPLSLLTAFVMMHVKGVAANLISLGAVDFGIIIDGAVVLVEALMVRYALGAHDGNQMHSGLQWRMTALKHTVVEMGRPILFSKAIIVLAFLPIFTFERVEGKIFAPMTYTLSFAILGAILLTLTLLPALISFYVKNHPFEEKHLAWMESLQDRYLAMLAWARPRMRAILAGAVALLAASMLLIPLLGSEFLPKLDEGNIWLTITLPPATNLEKTKEIERDIRAVLRSYREVKTVIAQVGRPDDGTDPKGPNNMEILADLQPQAAWRFADKEALIADMTLKIRAIPGVPTNFSQVIEDNVEESISGVKGEIAVKIFGPDLDILEDKAEQVAGLLGKLRGAADVAAIRVGGQTELDIVLDRTRLARYGINAGDVNATVQTALAGASVSTYYDQDRRYDITVRLEKSFRDAVDDVAEVPVALPGGNGTIPLSAIANIEVRQGPARIGRESGGRYVAVKANLLGRDQGGFVAEAQARVKEQVRLPAGYSITWGGQFENQQRATKRLALIVPLSVLGIFVILFWAFRSMRLAGLVLFMVPFTWIGGLSGLALTGLHMSVSAAVGFIAVAGISVQNGVIMVEQFMDGLRNGRPVAVAVRDGARGRLRPVLMTALMAGLGLLPAALSHGIGSETQRPFAVVIVGGIISATFFTLLLLPILFPSVCDAEED